MSRQSHHPDVHDGNDHPAPERPVPPQEAHAGWAPPQPVCRPTLQGHAMRRHLQLATIAASMRLTR